MYDTVRSDTHLTEHLASGAPAEQIGSKKRTGKKAPTAAARKSNGKGTNPATSSSLDKGNSIKKVPKAPAAPLKEKSSKAASVRRKRRGEEDEVDGMLSGSERDGGEDEADGEYEEYEEDEEDEGADEHEGDIEHEKSADEEDEEDEEDEMDASKEHEDEQEDKHSHTQPNKHKIPAKRSDDPLPPIVSKKPSTNTANAIEKSQPEKRKETGKGKGREREEDRKAEKAKDNGRKDKGKGKAVAQSDNRYVVAPSSTSSLLITARVTDSPPVRTKEKNRATPTVPADNAASTSKAAPVARHVSQPTAKTAKTVEPSQRRCFSQPNVSLSSASPQWLRDATQHFRSLGFSDPRWLAIVDCLLRLEFAMGFPDSQVCWLYMLRVTGELTGLQLRGNRLTASNRPPEVAQWIQGGRRYDKGARLATGPRAKAFAGLLRAWWYELQPGWREPKDVWPMLKTGSDISWDELCRGGHNGVFLFVLALSWLPPTCLFDDALVTDLLDDVLWVFQQMVMDVGGNEEDIFGEPSASSQRLPLLTSVAEDDDDMDVTATERPQLPRRPPPTVEVTSLRKRKATDAIAPEAKKKQKASAPAKRGGK